ncbi:hypothetical protein Rhe02_51590 [Rhizocola hellebori]|uniref:CBM2 domain-containing protein n=1 Tax=Rhizocola hellebori TaxID=1392758 RepID=A0A8J3VI83_9ACTN|nr:cellulose binding domain-containing protein [Rhizocola hellebori]GIH07092.1 hypothetical protein Rhe02_51590 [Rhizocola hellebori]
MRPATVEELAAAERSEQPSLSASIRDRAKKPLVIGAATASLLVAGAGAVALAHVDSPPTMVQPQGEAAPFGVGYVDGFGEHSPKPTEKTSPKQSTKPKSAAAAPQMTPPGQPTIVVASSEATPSIDGGVVVEEGELAAVYWVAAWRNSYDVYVWVHNSGSAPASWNLRIQLPANTTISATWAAHREGHANNAWVFTPAQGGMLAPGRTYLFAFEGKRPSGAFALKSCTVNGIACTKFGGAA